MNEAETRADYIDPSLKSSGWGVVEGSRIRREYPITLGRLEGSGKRGKPLTADYVLEYKNTKLAVVEAKAYDEPLTLGVAQSKNYAAKLELRYTYSTNGQGIYFIDLKTGIEREVSSFPSPEELWSWTFTDQNSWRDRFAKVPFEDRSGYFQGRYYQDIAVERVLAAIANKKDRILLTLATGTGKTFIAFQIAWKLFQSRWNLLDWKSGEEPLRRPRILFLADRINLAEQAYNDFSAFTEDSRVHIEAHEIAKTGKVPKNGNLFFTIFQTFMSGRDEKGNSTPYFGEYPKDFFDFIIIDECHRGGANDESTWRGILDYFSPAVQLGLTATPKRKDNANTYDYFGDPVFIYSLKEGINDGYLTPFRVKQISTTLDEYVYTSDDQVIEGEAETGRRYEEKDFNRTIEIMERERKRVEIFMNQIDQREKTIVFCATQSHALVIRDIINQMKSSTDPNYCQRVTANDGELGNQALRDFRDNEKTIPTVLTTSQKLSTGVDARNVRNIVLLRPVNSMIEFKQIIGRGTRLYEGKDYFTIYDFVKAHHHFNDPEWDGEPLDPEKPGGYTTPEPKPQEVHEDVDESQKKKRLRIKLADGKARTIQSMMVTSFWHPDGTPMSAQQFMESLFGSLPEFFKDEDELRTLWSLPETRRKLLDGLAEKGFGRDQLLELQRIIDAEKCDLFDVLAYVAYATMTSTREERATMARENIGRYTDRQQQFLDFVLGHYITEGVDELDQEKLTPLLKLKYHDSLADAIKDLGKAESIAKVFSEFQKYLYQTGTRAS